MIIPPTVLKLMTILFGWYVLSIMISKASAGRSREINNTMSIPLLDKQHDYKIKFERAEAVHYDKHYMKSLSITTFKYNRTCPVVNASLMYNVDVGNDLEVVTQFYKFASNEYRLFPARFQFNFCSAVQKNTMGLGDFRKCGTFKECPLLKGKNIAICNWAPNPAAFPPLIPNGQYMVELQAMFGSAELFVVRAYGTVSRPIPGTE